MTCPLYKKQETTIHSKERHADMQQRAGVDRVVVWCEHAASPAPYAVASRIARSQDLLTCCGDLNQCQVPVDRR